MKLKASSFVSLISLTSVVSAWGADAEGTRKNLAWLTVGEERRYYTLIEPDSLQPGTRYALLIGFHGNRSQVKSWLYDYAAFEPFVTLRNFILVYPQAPLRWVAKSGDRDLLFFDALVAEMEKQFPIDPSRVYVFGHSNGGGFATYLLHARPNIVAAVATHSGIYPPDYDHLPPPEHKAPLFVIWGEKDEISPADSKAVQSCLSAFRTEGFPVETLVLPDWGHSWGGETHRVEEKIISFFFRHQLPASALKAAGQGASGNTGTATAKP